MPRRISAGYKPLLGQGVEECPRLVRKTWSRNVRSVTSITQISTNTPYIELTKT